MKINELITILRPNEHISPFFISLEANIDTNTVIKLLNLLAERELILVKYLLRCNNEDPDLIHEHEFFSDDDLFEFYREFHEECPDCESHLISTDIRVAYQRKEIEFYEHD